MRKRVHKKSGTRILELLPSTDEIGGYPFERILLTSRQVAIALGIKQRTLAYWTARRHGKRPRLSYIKLGKAKRFVAADVLQFIDRLKVRSDKETKLAA
jgi:hypothetical protein